MFARKLPVQHRKEIFYRFMLPLVLHANEMVMKRRNRLLEIEKLRAAGKRATRREFVTAQPR